jgi:hypothetical protein
MVEENEANFADPERKWAQKKADLSISQYLYLLVTVRARPDACPISRSYDP